MSSARINTARRASADGPLSKSTRCPAQVSVGAQDQAHDRAAVVLVVEIGQDVDESSHSSARFFGQTSLKEPATSAKIGLMPEE